MNNEYWLGKIRLWFALRGGVMAWFQHHREEELCENCRYYQATNKVRKLGTLVLDANGYRNFEYVRDCKREKEFRGKLMASSDLKTIEFRNESPYPYHFICAEWIKNA
jgi:hypothetical protein